MLSGMNTYKLVGENRTMPKLEMIDDTKSVYTDDCELEIAIEQRTRIREMCELLVLNRWVS